MYMFFFNVSACVSTQTLIADGLYNPDVPLLRYVLAIPDQTTLMRQTKQTGSCLYVCTSFAKGTLRI